MNPLYISELLAKILAYIKDATTYKEVRLVSHNCLVASGDRIDEFANHLETLIKLYPDMDWNWDDLSYNPSISIDFIKNHKHFPWNYYKVLTRENINLQDIQDIYPLYAYAREMNVNVVTNRYYFITKNISLNWDPDILNVEHIDGFWLSQNKNLTIEHFKSMKGKITFYYDQLLANSNLNWQDVFEIWGYREWGWASISTNPNVTIEKVFIDKGEWAWHMLSSNKSFFQTGPMHKIWKFITDHLEYNWNWNYLSEYIAWEIIIINLDNIKYKWNWSRISMNWTVTPKIIEENPHLPWNWDGISLNRNLTFRFITKYKDKIDYLNLSYNTFNNFSHHEKII